ncbi:hypothetical protein ACGF5O_07645 [Streptomyces sp. NPDC048291]|uniref:hypothetical protein n=1 Tax=Streptomyces sp. NPDC048291 TaxID=3365530 RepID=UPI00371098B0
MNPRSHLPTAAAAGLTVALLVSGCGGGAGDDGGPSPDDTANKVPATRTSASPGTSATVSGRPAITLPSDLTYTFDWPSTQDTAKDAVLADSEQNIKAVDLAIANQDPLDKAYRFYFEGEAAAQIQRYVQAYVTAKARTTGHYRYYEPVVNVSAPDKASLVYCEDQGKAYDLYLETKKVDRTAVTKNSYVLYSTQLHKNDKGVWVTEKLSSQRGSTKCQP